MRTDNFTEEQADLRMQARFFPAAHEKQQQIRYAEEKQLYAGQVLCYNADDRKPASLRRSFRNYDLGVTTMKRRFLSMLLILAIFIPSLSCFQVSATADQVREHTPIYIGYASVDYGADLILQQIGTDGLTDREKIRAVYHWVILNCQRNGTADTIYYNPADYSDEIQAYGGQIDAAVQSGQAAYRAELVSELYPGELDDYDAMLDTNWMVAYEASSMMAYRIGDCLNYSALLTVLLNHLGFDCRIIGGDFINSDGSYAMHKWNCVLVDGTYYWLDVRMDHSWYTSFGRMYDKFFMITDKSEWQTRHSWDDRYSDWLFANAAAVQSYIQPHVHTWNSGELTRPMTAYQNGIVTYTCTRCSAQYTVTLPAGGSPFVDVQNQSSYYYQPVIWAADAGVVYGTSAFTFSPAQGCTRAQLVTFLWRQAGKPGHQISSCSFRDVSSDAWYYDAVLWAVEKGIVYGVTENEFRPDAAVSRCQAVTLIWRAAGEPEAAAGSTVAFQDVSEEDYYYAAVAWGASNGVVYGKAATAFDPASQVTRCDAVTFLWRYSQKQN